MVAEIVRAILDAVDAIPETIWGVLIGSGLTWVATHTATRRQLRHDAEQRDVERKMQLRKEVFLEVAEGVPGTESFMKLANAEQPLNDITMTTTRPGWLNKLQTVASAEAVEAFYAANAALGAAGFELLSRRIAIDQIKTRIDAVDQSVAAMKAVQERIRETAATVANGDPTPEVSEQLQIMQQHWDQTWTEIENLNREGSSLLDEKFRRQLALFETAVEFSLSYQKQLRRALLTLRAELGIPIDNERLESALDRIDNDMLPKFRSMLNTMKEGVQTPAV